MGRVVECIQFTFVVNTDYTCGQLRFMIKFFENLFSKTSLFHTHDSLTAVTATAPASTYTVSYFSLSKPAVHCASLIF